MFLRFQTIGEEFFFLFSPELYRILSSAFQLHRVISDVHW